MSYAATAVNTTVSVRFATLWLLSAFVPGLILAYLYGVIRDTASLTSVPIIAILPIPLWLLVGLLQFLLLRTRLRRSGAWIWATLVGGAIGHFAGGFSLVHTQPYFEELLLRSELSGGGAPPWTYSVYPIVPPVLANAINLAVVATAQSFCFDKGTGGRAVWIVAAIPAGLLGPICTLLVGWSLFELLVKTGLFEILPRWFPVTLFTMPLTPIVNFTIYGLITGLTMRWLLNRRARRQAKALVGEFD